MNLESAAVTLLTCPRCLTINFSLIGLRTHQCTGVNRQSGGGERKEKRRLTAAELAQASFDTRTAALRDAP